MRHRLLATLLAALLIVGCAGSSPQRDLARVNQLSKRALPERLVEGEVEATTDEEVEQLMKEPLTQESAVRVALTNHRELRAQLRELGVVRGKRIQAGLLPNPIVEVELLPERETQLELRLEYDITHALLAPFRGRAVEPELEAARLLVASRVIEVGGDVRAAFVRLQATEARYAQAKTVVEAFAAEFAAAESLVDSGNQPELSRTARQAALEQARVDLAAYELDTVVTRERLQRQLGTYGETAYWQLGEPLGTVPETVELPESAERDAVRANLALQSQRHKLEALARQAGAENAAGWIPDVSADFHALKESPDAIPTTGETWRYGGGFTMSVPLFDRNQGHVTALRAQFDAQTERYLGRAVNLRSQVRELRFRLSSAHLRTQHFQRVLLPLQEKLLEQTLLQVNAMQIGVFDLLAARRRQLLAALGAIDARRDYFLARIELDVLMAGGMGPVGSEMETATMQSGGQSAGGH